MKLIPLTKGYHAMVDDEDYERLSSTKWYARIGKNTVYAIARDASGKSILMHRIILGMTKRHKKFVDHINGNGLDNRKENLRRATIQQNYQNSRKRLGKGHSKYKGAYWARDPKKWMSTIKHNYKIIYLGTFETEIEAALAYDTAARELFGEFARTNF